jgi:hypothetical protein
MGTSVGFEASPSSNWNTDFTEQADGSRDKDSSEQKTAGVEDASRVNRRNQAVSVNA